MLVLSVTDQPPIHPSIPSFLHSDGLHAEQISDYSLVLIVVGDDDGNTPVQSKGGLCLFPFADHSDQYIQTMYRALSPSIYLAIYYWNVDNIGVGVLYYLGIFYGV